MAADTQNWLPWPTPLRAAGVIFFTRHGQCRSNTVWPIEGYHDNIDPLTELGREQARCCGRYLKDIMPGITWKIYSSVLRRAVETAAVISGEARSVSMGADPRINEYSDKAEDHASLFSRLEMFLADAKPEAVREDERILVVTHGHVLSALACRALCADIQVVDKGGYGGQAGLATHANGGLTAFYRGDLLLWNAQAHLPVGAP